MNALTDAAVVDTNVVSYLLRSDSRAALYQSYLANTELILSFMTLAELHHWALKRRWKVQRRTILHQYLERQFEIHYADAWLCQKWSEVIYQCSQIGNQLIQMMLGLQQLP